MSENSSRCEKCGEFFEILDKHHIDKKNNPEKCVYLCKDCHYAEHHQTKEKFSGDILSCGYGILPNIILLDDDLPSTAKLLYVLISSLSADKGYCFANNKYLASKMKISATQVSVLLSRLEKYLVFKDRTNWRRQIYIYNNKENNKQPLRKLKGNHKEKLKHNIISNNIISIDNNTIHKEVKKLTELLFKLVCENYPFIKNKDITEKDYADIDKLNRIDGYDFTLIEAVIRWSQNDDFWKQNIRSTSKLRKQFETLLVKAKGDFEKRKVVNFDK